MLTISKPRSAGQAQTYQKEFTAKEQNYWSQQGHRRRLAGQFGLAGTVSAEDFAKLSQGQHPQTGSLCGNVPSHRTAYSRSGRCRNRNLYRIGLRPDGLAARQIQTVHRDFHPLPVYFDQQVMVIYLLTLKRIVGARRGRMLSLCIPELHQLLVARNATKSKSRVFRSLIWRGFTARSYPEPAECVSGLRCIAGQRPSR